MNLFTPTYCSVSKLTQHTTGDVQVFFYCAGIEMCVCEEVLFFCSFIVEERPSYLHIQMANRSLFSLCITTFLWPPMEYVQAQCTPNQEAACDPLMCKDTSSRNQRLKKRRSLHMETVLKTALQSLSSVLWKGYAMFKWFLNCLCKHWFSHALHSPCPIMHR